MYMDYVLVKVWKLYAQCVDLFQAAQPAGADDGGDFLQSPRPLYESDSSPCRAVVCRRREVCTVRADVAVCTPRAHHAHRNARAR
ncbi:hypothetical protein EVAR_95916_1 [Eumeta japonica]|uniref:Uncharacterized protein n=1 Tax=Eumeta variegata TaxID=151549 RepID=A0A4C1XG97_EUMVA|nr:hypothetical protein EVAR_95916_1 [Eumeta japonica]